MVFVITSFNVLKLNFPLTRVKIVVPKAPIAAASVGDAIPAKIDPSTIMISVSGMRKAVTIFFTL